VTGDALDFALESFGLSDPALRQRLLELYQRIEPFPDARPALARLREAGLRTAILSNGSPRMLAEAATHAGLAPLLDEVLSVEAVQVYKPHRAVYQLAASTLQLWPGEILFVSANGWDACSARAFGLRVAWCNRTGQPRERIPEPPDAEIRSLDELPARLGP
jgi:2-haloacid dehalogenase